MSSIIFDPTAINETDLTTPSSTKNPAYVLGGIYTTQNTSATNSIMQWVYVYATGALTAYVPYMLTFSNVSGQEVGATTPLELANFATVCVPQVDFTSGYYGFVPIAGQVTAAIAAAVTVGKFLLISAAAPTVFTEDGASLTVNSLATLVTATTTAANAPIYLFSGLNGLRTATITA